MAVIIEYNGVVIASASDGQTVRLACAGEVMKGNVVIRAIDDSLISFTIDGESYQAEAGMTWAEWCASKYNTGGFFCSGDFVMSADDIKTMRDHLDFDVDADSEIISGEAYQTGTGGAA